MVQESTNDSVRVVTLPLIVVILITVVVMAFRVLSGPEAASSMTGPGAQTDLDPPYNLPMPEPGSSTDLVEILPTTSFDTDHTITGQLRDGGTESLSANRSVSCPR